MYTFKINLSVLINETKLNLKTPAKHCDIINENIE